MSESSDLAQQLIVTIGVFLEAASRSGKQEAFITQWRAEAPIIAQRIGIDFETLVQEELSKDHDH